MVITKSSSKLYSYSISSVAWVNPWCCWIMMHTLDVTFPKNCRIPEFLSMHDSAMRFIMSEESMVSVTKRLYNVLGDGDSDELAKAGGGGHCGASDIGCVALRLAHGHRHPSATGVVLCD